MIKTKVHCRANNIIALLSYSTMAPLIAEYDRHMDEMTEELQRYQVKNIHIQFRQ